MDIRQALKQKYYCCAISGRYLYDVVAKLSSCFCDAVTCFAETISTAFFKTSLKDCMIRCCITDFRIEYLITSRNTTQAFVEP